MARTLRAGFVLLAVSIVLATRTGAQTVSQVNFAGRLITLDPFVQRLPKVITIDSVPRYFGKFLRDFEERRKTGEGYFIPEAILRKAEDRTLGNVIAAYVPTVTVKEDPQGHAMAYSNRGQKSSKPCPVDVYLDGVFVSVGATAGDTTIDLAAAPPAIKASTQPTRVAARSTYQPENDLNQYAVSNIAAAEFHNAANTPIEYMRTGGCGVLLLWTRER